MGANYSTESKKQSKSFFINLKKTLFTDKRNVQHGKKSDLKIFSKYKILFKTTMINLVKPNSRLNIVQNGKSIELV